MILSSPSALTIGGSDSSGASGIQADLSVFSAMGVHGLSVLTTVMAANTVEVAAIAEVPEEVVIAQIDSIAEDMGADALKLGILSSRVLVENIADRLEAWGIPNLVVDPVMMSPTGIPLLHDTALEPLIRDVLPLASLLVCGIEETASLVGRRITEAGHLEKAARRLHSFGPTNIFIRSTINSGLGPSIMFDGSTCSPVDIEFRDPQQSPDISGVFSAVITALLARGESMANAVTVAVGCFRALHQSTFAPGRGGAMLDLRARVIQRSIAEPVLLD